MIDVITSVIGEVFPYGTGLIIGRTFHMEPKRAQRIGEMFFIFLLSAILIVLTVFYSE